MALSYFQGNAGVKNAQRRLKEFGHEVSLKDPHGHLHPRRRKRYADEVEQVEEVGTGEDVHGSSSTESVPGKARPVKKHFKDWKTARSTRKQINALNRAAAIGPRITPEPIEVPKPKKEKKDGAPENRERREPKVRWKVDDRRRRRRTRHTVRLAQRSRRLLSGDVSRGHAEPG